MTRQTKTCRQSTLVYDNCDQCGQRPDVIHKPAARRGERYCGECCPACRKDEIIGNGDLAETDKPAASPEAATDILRRLSGDEK